MGLVNFETKNYRALLDTVNGNILAYSNTAHHYKIETNINNKENSFSYTNEDFLILKAREVKEKLHA